MPDQYGNPTEAELRGQVYQPTQGYSGSYSPETLAAIQQRNAGNGSQALILGDRSYTGAEFRAAPELSGYRQDALASGMSAPNLLFGAPEGRNQSPEERAYRQTYYEKYVQPMNHGFWSKPEYVLPAFIAAAAGGAALVGAAGGAGAGGAGGAGAGAGGAAAGTGGAAAGGGTGLLGGATAAEAAGAGLPEIVVTGTVPAGITAGQAATIGAGAGGLGSALSHPGSTYNGNSSTSSSGPAPTDYGQYGGWQGTSDPVGEFGQGIGTGSDAGDLAAGAGGGGGLLSNLKPEDYIKLGQGLLGGGGGGSGGQGGGSVIIAPQAAPQNNQGLMMRLMRANRAQALRRKLHRTPQENEELRQLSGFSVGKPVGLVA